MKQQRGFALIVTVVLLMVAAIIGLYAMRSAITQEKASANIYNKTITTNAAEHGVSKFYEWANSQIITSKGWPLGISTPSDRLTWSSQIPANAPGSANIGSNGYFWIDARDKDKIVDCNTANPCWDDTKEKYEVTAIVTGNLVQGTTVLGTSKIRVKLRPLGSNKLPELPGALTLGGNVSAFDAANSNVFGIEGKSKLAIATGDSASNSVVKGAIPANRLNNYQGNTANCIANTDLRIWNQPTELLKFINSIASEPGVTIINGDVDNNSLSTCSGILIIKGNLTINGRGCGTFNGVIVVLGGTVQIRGGGNLDINGGLYVAKIVATPNTDTATFGHQSTGEGFIVNGGGNMTINYDNSYFASFEEIAKGKYATRAQIIEWADVL